MTQMIPSNSKVWTPSIFNKFFEILDKIMISEEDKNLLLEAKSGISCIISPQGRFKEIESQTSLGLVNGSWLLYDDIQFELRIC